MTWTLKGADGQARRLGRGVVSGNIRSVSSISLQIPNIVLFSQELY